MIMKIIMVDAYFVKIGEDSCFTGGILAAGPSNFRPSALYVFVITITT